MERNMFREIENGEDVTDIVAGILAFVAITAAVFVIVVALWTVFVAPANANSPVVNSTQPNSALTAASLK